MFTKQFIYIADNIPRTHYWNRSLKLFRRSRKNSMSKDLGKWLCLIHNLEFRLKSNFFPKRGKETVTKLSIEMIIQRFRRKSQHRHLLPSRKWKTRHEIEPKMRSWASPWSRMRMMKSISGNKPGDLTHLNTLERNCYRNADFKVRFSKNLYSYLKLIFKISTF